MEKEGERKKEKKEESRRGRVLYQLSSNVSYNHSSSTRSSGFVQ